MKDASLSDGRPVAKRFRTLRTMAAGAISIALALAAVVVVPATPANADCWYGPNSTLCDVFPRAVETYTCSSGNNQNLCTLDSPPKLSEYCSSGSNSVLCTLYLSPAYTPTYYSGNHYTVTTFASGPGYRNTGAWSGTLNAGKNWVLCKQKWGTYEGSYGENYWWLWTLLDSPAGAYGWVSAYWLAKWDSNIALTDTGGEIENCGGHWTY